MLRVSIRNQQEIIELDYPRLKEIAQTVLAGEQIIQAKVTLAFFDNTMMQVLNERHLQHVGPTDVLTFAYSDHRAKILEGDIAIGAEIALQQSQERGHDVLTELCLYVIHGCLHLCGYDDIEENDAAEMRQKEREYLLKMNLPDIAGDPT